MNDLLDHIRYALRQFRLSPVFTLTAVLTLALGIGGATAIFTLINAVMLRSLPVVDPASLYRIGDGDDCCVQGSPQDRWGFFSYQLFETLKANAPEFEELAAFQAGGSRWSVRRERVETAAQPLRSEFVTGNYFSTFGITPFAGRLFTPDDDTRASAPVVVLSHHTWESTYGSDPSVAGSTFIINGLPFTVAGIAPPGFFGDTLRGDPPDMWIPVHQEPALDGADAALLDQRMPAWLRVIGRLRPGTTTAGMAPRLTGVLRHWIEFDAGYPANWNVTQQLSKQTVDIVPAGSGVGEMKEEYGRSLQILLGVCGLVLLIACANVANLLLARSVARRGQTAVRLAIGASRRQIITQALVESVLLAVVGSIAGLGVSVAAAKLLLSFAFSNTQFLPISTMPSPLVLGFAFVLALVTGIVFGAVPAWLATRTNPVDALRGSGRSTSDHSTFARKALLVTQAALSVVLVAGSTMLGRSLGRLEHQNFGYQVTDRVLVAMNRLPSTYTPAQLAALYRAMEARLAQLPGVRGAGLALYNPLTDNWGELILVQGHPPPSINDPAGASWDRVTPGYLDALGVGVLRGRGLSATDNETAAPVAVVNEAFVTRFFKPGEEPLGQHFGLDEPQNVGTFRIVGVVRDAKFAGFALSQPARPMFYVPLAQTVDYKDSLMSRVEAGSHLIRGIVLVTSAEPGALQPVLTRALAEVDPNLTITSVRTMEQQIALSFNQERAVASLAGLFGIVALLLAAVGLYGVTAYSVAQRTNEIGIRMALGADRGRVVQLVLRGAFARVAVGLVLGIPLAIGAGRLLSAQLYGVPFWDPVALGVAAIALGMCAFAASIIPAGRAAAISPIKALRIQ
jgi:predicted permease